MKCFITVELLKFKPVSLQFFWIFTWRGQCPWWSF